MLFLKYIFYKVYSALVTDLIIKCNLIIKSVIFDITGKQNLTNHATKAPNSV